MEPFLYPTVSLQLNCIVVTAGVFPSVDHPCAILESGQQTAASSRAHQPGSGPLTGQAFSLLSQAYMGGNGAKQREGVREREREKRGGGLLKGRTESERVRGVEGDGDEIVMDFE